MADPVLVRACGAPRLRLGLVLAATVFFSSSPAAESSAMPPEPVLRRYRSGAALLHCGDAIGAAVQFSKAQEIASRYSDVDLEWRAAIAGNLGNLRRDLGDEVGARSSYRKARKYFHMCCQDSNNNALALLDSYAHFEELHGRMEAAAVLHQEGLQHAKSLFGENDPSISQRLFHIADLMPDGIERTQVIDQALSIEANLSDPRLAQKDLQKAVGDSVEFSLGDMDLSESGWAQLSEIVGWLQKNIKRWNHVQIVVPRPGPWEESEEPPLAPAAMAVGRATNVWYALQELGIPRLMMSLKTREEIAEIVSDPEAGSEARTVRLELQ